MGAEVLIPLLLSAASAGVSSYNTNKTAKRQDNAAANAIREQSAKQRRGDARVNEEVNKLQGSSSADEKAKRGQQYSDQLRRNVASVSRGLTPGFGGAAFQADSAGALDGVVDYGASTGDLMARMDAPMMQRQGEATGFGNLGTDIDILSRESRGQSFIDELRMRGIRRNPWLDMAAGGLSGAAGMFGGGGFGTAKPEITKVPIPAQQRLPYNFGP